MKLKNIVIVVDDIEKSVRFYEKLFGLQLIMALDGNVIMSEGLVLQDVGTWHENIKIHTIPCNNMTELYFEEKDMENFIKKLESYDFCLNYVTKLSELEGGQKVVRFYDPNGNLIEVRTPYN